MRLSSQGRAALRLLASSDKESLNAYGLSQLRGYEYGDTQPCLRVLKELVVRGFLRDANPGGHRAWGPECDHYRIDFEQVRDWCALDAVVPPALAEVSLSGPRERLSVLAA